MSKLPAQERYLNNLIDDNFQNVLYPINTAMSALLLPHFNLRDGFITPNNLCRKLKSFILTICLLIVCYFRFSSSPVLQKMKTRVSFIVVSVYFDWFYYSITFICLFISNIINTDNYVNLVVSLQKAFRNFSFVKKDIAQLRLWNWVSISAVPCYFLVIFVPLGNFSIAAFLNLFPMIYFDMTVVYTFCIMWLIEKELNMWLNEMQYCSRSTENLGFIGEKKELRMFETYKYILNAYDLFKKVCRVPVSSQNNKQEPQVVDRNIYFILMITAINFNYLPLCTGHLSAYDDLLLELVQ